MTVEEYPDTLKPNQAARYIAVSDATLRLWRAQGKGPRFFRAGARLVRYRKSDLDQWLEQRLSEPTDSTDTK
jgi:excisionase family DNA binding protein